MILYLIFQLSFSIRSTDFISIDENDKWYVNSYEIPSNKSITYRLDVNTIYNLTYEHCEFDSLWYEGNGGAIYINTSSIYYAYCKFVECTFINCSSNSGGALYITTDNNLTNIFMISCLFDNNECDNSSGGAVFVKTATLTLYGCEFNYNNINICNGDISCGGAICALESTGYFENCSFINNKITLITKNVKLNEINGGAIYCLISNFIDCIFINNCIYIDGYMSNFIQMNGGAIYTEISNFTNCEFINNSMVFKQDDHYNRNRYILNGGSVYSITSDFNNCNLSNNCILLNSVFFRPSNSYSPIGGGAIFTNCSYFTNCIITGNNLLLNTSVNGNHSYEAGGGVIYCNYLFLKDCLINENYIFFQSSEGIICGGGAIYTVIFIDAFNCTFEDNFIKSIYEIGWFSGGAIFSKSEAYLTNCLFNRNFVNGETFNCWSELKGGAICVYTSDIKKCSFCDNYIYMNSTIIRRKIWGAYAYGGASDNPQLTNFSDCFFFNNTIYAYGTLTIIIGSAISETGYLNNCSFIDNHVIAHLDDLDDTYIRGGIISGSPTKGFSNCLFLNNWINVSGEKTILEGGCISLYYSKMINCSYINNSVFSYSKSAKCNGNIYLRLKSVYSIYSTIEYCKFINNTSHSFGSNSVIKGGGLYITTLVEIKNCFFYNNSGNIYDNLSSIEGGIQFNCIKERITIKNCTFKNNNAYSLYEYKSKIISAIYFYLKSFMINACQFIDNNANYGYDLYFSTYDYFALYFYNCKIEKHCSSGLYSKSIFYFTYSYESAYGYYFENNIIMIYNPNNNTRLFDAGTKNQKTNKWTFKNNCIYPYDENLFKNSSISFYDDKTSYEIKFNKAFNHACLIQTEIFTNSQYFSDSNIFTRSAYFSFTKEFSESSEFSRSKQFSQSNKFSKSNCFYDSNKFSKSEYFSDSQEFSKSNCFYDSNKFSKSDYFSDSQKFSKSNCFYDSNKFSKSEYFSDSQKFSKSNCFYNSNKLSKSEFFSDSHEFSKSNCFYNSNKFSKSDYFSDSQEFSKSNCFYDSNKFSKSEYFSDSQEFSKSNIFSYSIEFSEISINQQSFIQISEKLTTIKENESGTMIDEYSQNSILTRSNLIETESKYFTVFDQISDSSIKKGGVSNTIIGIIVGIIAAVTLITIASILIIKRRKNSKEKKFNDAEKETSFIDNQKITKSTLENSTIEDEEKDLDFWL